MIDELEQSMGMSPMLSRLRAILSQAGDQDGVGGLPATADADQIVAACIKSHDFLNSVPRLLEPLDRPLESLSTYRSKTGPAGQVVRAFRDAHLPVESATYVRSARADLHETCDRDFRHVLRLLQPTKFEPSDIPSDPVPALVIMQSSTVTDILGTHLGDNAGFNGHQITPSRPGRDLADRSYDDLANLPISTTVNGINGDNAKQLGKHARLRITGRLALTVVETTLADNQGAFITVNNGVVNVERFRIPNGTAQNLTFNVTFMLRRAPSGGIDWTWGLDWTTAGGLNITGAQFVMNTAHWLGSVSPSVDDIYYEVDSGGLVPLALANWRQFLGTLPPRDYTMFSGLPYNPGEIFRSAVPRNVFLRSYLANVIKPQLAATSENWNASSLEVLADLGLWPHKEGPFGRRDVGVTVEAMLEDLETLAQTSSNSNQYVEKWLSDMHIGTL